MKPLLTVLLVCYCTLAKASNIDSLMLLTKASQDTAVAVALFDIGRQYFGTNMDTTLLLFNASKDYSNSIGYINGEVQACVGVSAVAFRLGKIEESVAATVAGLQLVEEHGLDQTISVKLLLNRGSAMTASQKSAEALEAFTEALKICRAKGLDIYRAKILNNLGIIYRQLQEYDRALEVYDEGLALKASIGDSLGLATTYFNRGAVYSKKDDLNNAIKDISAAEALYNILGAKQEELSCQQALGHAYFEKGEIDTAYDYLNNLYNLEEYDPSAKDRFLMNLLLSQVHLKRGQVAKAEQLLAEVADLEESEYQEERLELMRQKAEVAAAKGDNKNAYKLQQTYIEAYKETNKKEVLKQRSEMETKYRTAEKDFEIETLGIKQELTYTKLKASRQRSIGLGVGLLVLAGLLYRLYRLNGQIREKNKVITKANKDKEILLKEIHHRVKNNLQVVSSLLGLQSRFIKDDTALKAINTGRSRVQSMSILHRKLYQNKDLKSVNVKEYFEDLGENLFTNYKWSDNQIAFEADVEQLELDVDVVIPMGLITNELISNALKYGFEGRETGLVKLRIFQQDEDIILKVSDDGVGIPFTEIPRKSESLGMQLIKSFAEKLDAELEIKNENGTTFKLTIPKKQETQSPI